MYTIASYIIRKSKLMNQKTTTVKAFVAFFVSNLYWRGENIDLGNSKNIYIEKGKHAAFLT